jgi:signal transduction histidine kinase
MISGIARTREIIHGLSHFAAESGSERRRHDLRELIDQAVDSLRGDAPEGIRFEVEGERPIEIECDEREIRRLLLNILDNAVRSIDGRGMVRLSTESGPGIVSIAIADTGCGISEKIGRRIFEPFFTTREVGSGTGLGLAIAYAIARRHRGEITVTSIEGRGSTFTVTLPRG